MKLTAQFVARNGRQFLTNLMNREQVGSLAVGYLLYGLKSKLQNMCHSLIIHNLHTLFNSLHAVIAFFDMTILTL